MKIKTKVKGGPYMPAIDDPSEPPPPPPYGRSCG